MLKELNGLLAKIKKEGSFARNISIASSWNMAGILVQFFLSPIITRLYTPSEYGVFAVFNSIVLNVSIINTLRYSDTIILATGNKQRNNAIALTLFIVSLVTSLSCIAIIVFSHTLINFIGKEQFTNWIYLLPLSIFMAGVIEVLLLINIRSNRIFRNGLAGFMQNLSSRGFNIIYGILMHAKASGLIAGELLGKVFAISNLLARYRSISKSLKSFYVSLDAKSILALARIYRHFPLYNLPSNLLVTLSGHIPVYFLQFQYSSSIVGAYALSNSLLEIVNRLVPYSISSVFLPKAMELKRESIVTLGAGAYRLFLYLLIGAVLLFGFTTIISPSVFPLLFGKNWIMAGSFTSILSLSFAFNFIALALTEIFKAIDKQRLFLITTLVAVTLKVGGIVGGIVIGLEMNRLLWLYAIAGAIGGFFQTIVLFVVLKYKPLNVGMMLALLFASLTALGYVINF